MKMKITSIIYALIIAIIGSIIGEITFGNPGFLITVWSFDKISSWQWDIPVHGIGFIWLLLMNHLFFDKNIILPTLLSTLFFMVGELANYFYLHYFSYYGPFGVIGAFVAIAILYSSYNFCLIYVLRKT